MSPYQALATIGGFLGGHKFYYNGRWIRPYGPTSNANPALKWEVIKQIDIGLDFTLFKNGLLEGSFDWYRRNTTNLVGHFSAMQPPRIFPTIIANAGNMLNKGFELTLNAHLIQSNNFQWNLTFTGSYNKNEIGTLSSEQFKGTAQPITYIKEGTPTQRLASGHPVAVFYGRVFAGFTDNGKHWLFKNSEGEVVRASKLSTDDFRYLGNSIPRYNLALTNNFGFRNFDITMMLTSALDFNVLNAKNLFLNNLTYLGRTNLFASATNNLVKAPPLFSSYYLENGNYLKLKKISVGYSLPVENLGTLKSLRIYLTGTNLLTITSFSGQDPELKLNWVSRDGSETSAGPGVEPLYSYYPSTRIFQLGISIGL